MRFERRPLKPWSLTPCYVANQANLTFKAQAKGDLNSESLSWCIVGKLSVIKHNLFLGKMPETTSPKILG